MADGSMLFLSGSKMAILAENLPSPSHCRATDLAPFSNGSNAALSSLPTGVDLGAGGMHCSALTHGPAALAPRPLVHPSRSPVRHGLRSSHGPAWSRGSWRAASRSAPRAAPRDVEVESAAKVPDTRGTEVPLGQIEELDAALAEFTAARSAQESMEQQSARSQGVRGVPEPVAELETGRKALELARSLAAAGVLKGFGKGPQVPRRAYSIDELRLHRIDTSRLLSPKDTTLGQVRSTLQLALLAGLVAAWLQLDQLNVLFWLLLLLTLGTADQIGTGGALESLTVDTIGHVISRKYRERVCLHEAGHFVTAYLLGVLPASYTISSLDSLQRLGVLSAQQAGTTFVDVEFQQQVQSGKLKSEVLEEIVCVGLAGICAEYVVYGVAEGGVTDIQQLDSLFRSLRFSQTKSDEVVRWAVLNTVSLLRKHRDLLSEVASCLQERKSVGQCIAVVERKLCLE